MLRSCGCLNFLDPEGFESCFRKSEVGVTVIVIIIIDVNILRVSEKAHDIEGIVTIRGTILAIVDTLESGTTILLCPNVRMVNSLEERCTLLITGR